MAASPRTRGLASDGPGGLDVALDCRFARDHGAAGIAREIKPRDVGGWRTSARLAARQGAKRPSTLVGLASGHALGVPWTKVMSAVAPTTKAVTRTASSIEER